jgi:hypothetical protein
VALYGSVQDITERKVVEAVLRASLEQLHMAQVAAKAGVWSWDVVTAESIPSGTSAAVG